MTAAGIPFRGKFGTDFLIADSDLIVDCNSQKCCWLRNLEEIQNSKNRKNSFVPLGGETTWSNRTFFLVQRNN